MGYAAANHDQLAAREPALPVVVISTLDYGASVTAFFRDGFTFRDGSAAAACGATAEEAVGELAKRLPELFALTKSGSAAEAKDLGAGLLSGRLEQAVKFEYLTADQLI